MDRNTSDDVVLEARLNDAVRIAEGGRTHFVGFLDQRQAELARRSMARLGFSGYLLWGGHSDAERVLFGAFPSWQEPDQNAFPLTAVTASYRKVDKLSHRDFLGALLSKGVVRETLGDLLVEEGRCVLFVRDEVADFLLQQTEKIGRVGVTLETGFREPLPNAHTYEDFSDVVASARLDCIVAATCSVSRTVAGELISGGLVMLDHRTEVSLSAEVREGAVLSVRGKGRFLIDRLGPPTKKGRLSIGYRKCV